MLPETLIQALSSGEISALLGHEIAHLRQRDLIWCVGWRWMNAVFWFHPLAWAIPAAHNLACEQEADRIASSQLESHYSYAQLLAQIALRLIAIPPAETRLVLNGASQIAQRLNHLSLGAEGSWKLRHSVASFGLTGLLFLMTVGWDFSQINAANSKHLHAHAFKEVLIVVQDEDGKPIEGATILPDGLRVKGREVNHYGWSPTLHGTPVRTTTDREGKSYVRYPVVAFPDEQLETAQISFSVDHPDFTRVRPTEYPVDGTAKAIRLIRGIQLEVSGHLMGETPARRVLELVPNLSDVERAHPEDWRKDGDGTLSYHRLSPGGHVLQLRGRVPSGEIVYSEGFDFVAERGKRYSFNLEMKPGIRVEGRIDEKVPRPVKNGRILTRCKSSNNILPGLYPKTWTSFGKKLDRFASGIVIDPLLRMEVLSSNPFLRAKLMRLSTAMVLFPKTEANLKIVSIPNWWQVQ